MSDVVGQATRLELLSVADPELLLIDTDGAGEVTAYEATLEVVEVGDTTALIESSEQLSLLEVGTQGPPGAGGGGGGCGGVFILDVQGVGGIVGQKVYAPDGATLDTALSDTANVRVLVGADGGVATYSPRVLLNSQPVALVETATKRWFTGYANLTLGPGNNQLVAEFGTSADIAVITLAGAGPTILALSFGAFPGAQTQLKSGDTLSFTATVEPEATSITLQAGGAVASAITVSVVGGAATGTIQISGASGAQAVYATAKNSLGTEGAGFASHTLPLDQTYPTIGAIVVAYPASSTAFGGGEAGTLTAPASNFDTISYAATGFTVEAPSVYGASKAITLTTTGYQGAGTNLTITATRAANAATTVRAGLAKYATVAPTATITIAGSPAKLSSSPAGLDYEVRITPTQELASAPALTASLGAWQGSWALSGAYWKRNLRISDSTPRGAGTFSGLAVVGRSNITGDQITSGGGYTVGGMSLRTLTFPAFSRTAAIGAAVSDQTKTAAGLAGGAALARHTDNTQRAGGYYISDANGVFAPNGTHLALSDAVFAGSNTSGTLQVTFQEVA